MGSHHCPTTLWLGKLQGLLLVTRHQRQRTWYREMVMGILAEVRVSQLALLSPDCVQGMLEA